MTTQTTAAPTKAAPRPRNGLAGAWLGCVETTFPMGLETRDTARVRSRIQDVLVERHGHELPRRRGQPETTPECGGQLAVIPAAGIQNPPMAVKVRFGGVSWVCILRETYWHPNCATPTADLKYEIQFNA